MKKSLLMILAVAVSLVSCQKDKIGSGKEQEKKIDLEVPSGLKLASYGEESIKMSWEAVENAEYYTYKIIAKVVHDGVAQDSLVAKGKTVNCYKTIEALDPKGEPRFAYWFAVAAGAGKISSSEYSSYVRCEPGGLTPLKPQNVEMSAYTDNGLSFKWDASEASDYYTYQLTNLKGEIIKTGDVQDIKITFDGLKKGRYYNFEVQGVNALNKFSQFTDPVTGLTFGQYIPALTFNASFDAPGYEFVAGTELTITDGVHDAGYVVVTSGTTTTLELITEQEVDYGANYTAYLPEEVRDHGVINSVYKHTSAGSFTGIPAWAESAAAGSTDLVFHPYTGNVALSLTSDVDTKVSSIRLVSVTALSGYVESATTGTDAKIVFSKKPIDPESHQPDVAGNIEYIFDEPVTVGKTPVEVSIPVPSGSYPNKLSAQFLNGDVVISGALINETSIEKGKEVKSAQSLKIVKDVVQIYCEAGKQYKVFSYATIATGAVEDYEYGLMALPFGESDWTKAKFVEGDVQTSTATRAVFCCPIDSLYSHYVRPCAKPSGTPISVAAQGPLSYIFFIDMTDPDYKIEAATEDQAQGGALYGVEFPTKRTPIKKGAKAPLTTYMFYGFPFNFSTNSQSGDRDYTYNRATNCIESNKIRATLFPGKAIPTFKAAWITFEKRDLTSTEFIVASKYKTAKQATEAGRWIDCEVTTVKAGGSIAVTSDSNKEFMKRFFILFHDTK